MLGVVISEGWIDILAVLTTLKTREKMTTTMMAAAGLNHRALTAMIARRRYYLLGISERVR